MLSVKIFPIISCAIYFLLITSEVAHGRFVPEIQRDVKGDKVVATWNEAKEYCESQGAILASPIDEAHLNYMQSYIAVNDHTSPYFIGFKATIIDYSLNFISLEGILLDELPEVVVDMIEQIDIEDGYCLSMGRHDIRAVSCSERLPYICYTRGLDASTNLSLEVFSNLPTQITEATPDVLIELSSSVPVDMTTEATSDLQMVVSSSVPVDMTTEATSDLQRVVSSSVPVDMTTEATSDLQMEVSSSVPVDMTTEATSDLQMEVSSSVPVDMATEATSDLQMEVSSSVPVDLATEATSDLQMEVSSSVPVDMATEATSDLQMEVSSSVPVDLATEATSDLQMEVSSSVPVDLATEATSDLQMEVSSSVPVDLATEATSDLQMEVSSSVPANMIIEVTTDVPIEVSSSVPVDMATEATSDLQMEVSSSVPVDMATEATSDLQMEVSSSVPVDMATEVKTEVPADGSSKEPMVDLNIDSGYGLFETGSWYKLHDAPLPWTFANETCAREGGYLVVINDAIEAEIIADLGDIYPHVVWIGLKKEYGDWRSVRGDHLKHLFNVWSVVRADYQCGVIMSTGVLDDRDCEYPLPFICEKSTDINKVKVY